MSVAVWRVHMAHQSIATGGLLKLLLTSGGVTNASIREALVGLLGKPLGDRHLRPGVRHRRPDGDEAGRRHGRGRVGRAMEAADLMSAATVARSQADG
jgi:hypothetical protein